MCFPSQRRTTKYDGIISQLPMKSHKRVLRQASTKSLSDDDSTGSTMMQQSHRGEKVGVTFNESVIVRNTLSLNDFSDEEIDSTWYSQNEHMEIQACCMKQVLKMDEDGCRVLQDDINHCSRGLECHTMSRRLARIQTRRESIGAVLSKQEEFNRRKLITQEEEMKREDEDEDLDEAIAMTYSDASSSSLLWARIVGLSDSRRAAAAQNEDGDDILLEFW